MTLDAMTQNTRKQFDEQFFIIFLPACHRLHIDLGRKKCSRGDQCTFAHDESQLRGKPDLAGWVSIWGPNAAR